MTVESPRIRSLLRQADRVADSGKRAAAEQLYRQIIEEAPETAQAWYGLAGVISDSDQKEAALEKAAALDPEYVLAQETAVEVQSSAAGVDKLMQEGAVETTAGPSYSKDGQTANSAHGVRADVPSGAESAQPETAAGDELIVGAATEDAADRAQVLFCANHPSRKTHLRCNRCGKPICSSCANPTPVGYRCPECIREQEDVYFTATPIDYVLAVIVALPLSLLAGWLATLLGFWSIFLAAFAGTLIGRVAFRAVRRQRGRWLPHVVAACVIIGGLLPALPYILALMLGNFSLQLLFTAIYIVMATGATYYQLR